MSNRGIVLHHKITSLIIELTSHKDLETLDNCLVTILAELAPVKNVELIHFYFDKEHKTLANTLQIIHTPKNNTYSSNFIRAVDISSGIIGSIATNFPIIAPYNEQEWHFIIPIQINGNIEACITLISAKALSKERDLIEDFLKIYTNHLSIINEGERDQLTGLLNRKSFNKRIERLLSIQRDDQHRRLKAESEYNRREIMLEEKSAWLAIVDIDHFKNVNDTFGHIYGDEVLLSLSQKLQANFRHSDLAFRFGGEEFVIVLEPIDVGGAARVLERFRKEIEQSDFPSVGKITVSIGFSKLGIEDFPPVVIEQADKALYYVKEHGRNNVSRYEALIESGAIATVEDKSSVELF